MKTSEMVQVYYDTAGIKPDPEVCETLIHEEFNEWFDEVDRKEYYNTGLELKELADLVYVIYGYALSKGWDLETALNRVHENNLARMFQDDGTIKRREDGKIIKNPSVPEIYLGDLT